MTQKNTNTANPIGRAQPRQPRLRRQGLRAGLKRIAITLIALVLAGLGGPLGSPAQAESPPFRLIVTDMEPALVPNSVMDLALREGYFDRAGVTVEIVRVQQTPMAMAALRAGEGEMANISVDALLMAVAQGAPDLRAVMSPNKALPFMIVGRDTLGDLTDLRGRRFGIGRPGSLDHSLSGQVMAAAGLPMAELDLVALGQPAQRAQALLAGQIDATTLSIGSYAALGEGHGLKVLVDVGGYFQAAPVVSKVNVTTTGVLDARRADVEAVITALTLAARDYADRPQDWAAAMRKARPDVAPATLDWLAEEFRRSWSVNGGLQRAEMQASADWHYGGADFQGQPRAPITAWADFAPLQAVLAKIGTVDGEDQPTQ